MYATLVQAADDTFTAGEGAAGAATLTAGDTLVGGAGVDTIRFVETGAVTALPVGLDITGVEVFTAIGGNAITLDLSALTSLTTVNSTNAAQLNNITAGAAADVNMTITSQTAAAATINGGKDVTATMTGATTAASSIGVTTAATGAVVASTQHLYVDGTGQTMGTVTITGGTTITSTQTDGHTAAELARQLADSD